MNLLIHEVTKEPTQDIEGDWYIIVRAEVDGDMEDTCIYSEEDNLYTIVRHCKSHMEPYEMQMED